MLIVFFNKMTIVVEELTNVTFDKFRNDEVIQNVDEEETFSTPTSPQVVEIHNPRILQGHSNALIIGDPKTGYYYSL